MPNRPILTPKTVLPIFFAIGIIFAPIGGLLLWSSAMVGHRTRKTLQMLKLHSRFKSFLSITQTAAPSRKPISEAYLATNIRLPSNPQTLPGHCGRWKSVTKNPHTECSRMAPQFAPCSSIFRTTSVHLFFSTIALPTFTKTIVDMSSRWIPTS
jgi:hypothetical protein